MNDVVMLEILRTSFWLVIFGISVWIFRREIRLILQSLGSFKIAGATFQLKDQRETLQSHALLAEILIDLLSRRDIIESLLPFISPLQIEKLGAFAIKYTKEVGDGQWNEELLRNIAILLLRSGRNYQAVNLYDALLLRRPDNYDLLNLKALALMTLRLDDKVKEAENILLALINRYPDFDYIRFNFALSKSLLGDHEESVKQLRILITHGYSQDNPKFLDDPLLHRLRESNPALIEQLKLESEFVPHSNLDPSPGISITPQELSRGV